MKQCLRCGKEFEPKRETRKFCSDSCRVMFNRKNGSKVTGVKPFQIQNLYNEFLDAIAAFKAENNKEYHFVEKGEIKASQTPVTATVTINANSLKDYVNKLRACGSIPEVELLVAEVKTSNLLWGEKRQFEAWAKEYSNENLYND